MNFSQRLHKIEQNLSTWHVDALIVTNPVDLLYITGLELSSGFLLITKTYAYLVVDGRYYEQVRKKLCGIVPLLRQQDPLYQCLSEIQCSSIGFDSSFESVQALAQYRKTVAAYKKKKGGSAISCVAIDAPLQRIRAVKDFEEIKKIEAACALCVEGFDYIKTRIREGVTEKQLARELEIFWIERGADRLAFPSIFAFSENSSMPHYRPQDVHLKKGDVILVDIGVVVDGYCSDMTRMLSFGVCDPQLFEIHAVVQKAQQLAVEHCVVGTPLKELDLCARDVINAHGYGEFFVHSLGHGLGLDVHEWPVIRSSCRQEERLVEGMCITVEPGIYIPGVGGSRVEDTLVVTREGPRILTSCCRDMKECLESVGQ